MKELRCVVCGQAGLSLGEGGDLTCTTCGTSFPVLSSVPVTLSRPSIKIVEEHRRYEFARSMALAKADSLESYAGENPQDSATPRLRRMAAGIRANQELADELFQPVGAFVADSFDQKEETLLNFLYQTMALGYDFELLLAYLYQDWAGDKAFPSIREKILRGAERHADRRGSVLVLGSGTGGLVHALADIYPCVNAVDLSMTAHLLARRILETREPLAMCLFSRKVGIPSQNDCTDLRLPPPRDATGSIQMLCADASRLPQASGETSLVVTQYLLDVVPDPERIVRELHRVLDEDGLWINFGLPFGRRGEEATVGTRHQHELGAFFAAHGFEVQEIDRGPFKLLDRTAVLPDSTLVVECPLFFVARKVAEGGGAADSQLFFDFFSGRSDAVASKIPILRQEVVFTESEVYGASKSRTQRKVSLGSPGGARAVPDQVEVFLRCLIENLNQGLSINQLGPRLEAQGAGAASVADLVETLRLLLECKIIDLR